MSYKVTKWVGIDSSHQLQEAPDPDSPCLRPHGHRYEFDVTVASSSLHMGMVVDFGDIAKVIRRYDHQDWNQWVEQPTAENILRHLVKELDGVLDAYPNKPYIERIGVKETPSGYAEFRPS